jgi:uncharacterized membrane protein YtjA (UPF0391 family)
VGGEQRRDDGGDGSLVHGPIISSIGTGIHIGRHPNGGQRAMLHYAIVFLVIALIAAVLGFGGIAAGAAGIAKILFVIFLIGAIVSFIMHAGRRV